MSLSRNASSFNLAAFNRIVFAAVVAGLLAGALLTAVQQFQVSKIILQAEVYEDAADAAKAAAPVPVMPTPPGHGQPGHDHLRDHLAPAGSNSMAGHDHLSNQHEEHQRAQHEGDEHQAGEHQADEHQADEHEHAGWQPANGIERLFFTVVANVSVAVSYALVLGAIFCMSGQATGWRNGLLWGAAGYAVFFLAPSLGLPPEVPGTAAAPLAARQVWWLATAMVTAGGLGLLVFGHGWPRKLAGVALLAAPHLIGAPQPQVQSSAAPEALAHAFIYATALANAGFWLALGGLTGWFYKKLA